MGTKYIFVTGGVLSGIGKGVLAASLGRLLKSRGFKIFVQKFDPYLNLDPGTMSPYEHGEVYVTADGAETDLDLGHYERFIDEKFTKHSNYTTAQIFKRIMEKERNGYYKGKTVQIVPHMTDEIEELIKLGGKKSNADFVITEIGGSVGDIESQSFFRSLASILLKEPENCFFMHTTYIPFLTASKEFKTKPSQRSISTIWSMSIKPNMALLRSTNQVTEEVKKKVSRTSFISENNIISVPDEENIYSIPLKLEKQKVAQKVLKHFGMDDRDAKLDDWKGFLKKMETPKKNLIEIFMIGKYVEFEDAYMSIIEALKISAQYQNTEIIFKWIQSKNITFKNIEKKMSGCKAAIILPGFGKRGFNGKIEAAKYLRNNNIPTLGICFGMQAMTIDQAHRQGIKDATSSEISESGTFVFDIIRGKTKNGTIGGTLRLGEHKTLFVKGSIAEKIYKNSFAVERHRHRFEVNPLFIQSIESKDFIFSGYDEKTNLAEVCEVKSLKFFFGVQYHPEFTARPLRPNPIFEAFIKTTIKYS